MSTSIASRSKKLLYIENIKTVLTILVVLHHTLIAYSSSDGWYYNEPTPFLGARVIMTMFISINQSFFMGYFFLLAAYFIDASHSKKGTLKFLTFRLIRLAAPLLFYSFILTPLMCYLVYNFTQKEISIFNYLNRYDSWIDLGVTWFIAALLFFTTIYIVLKKTFNISLNKPLKTPNSLVILLFAVGLGIISFFVRIIFPVGWILEPLGFQLGHFPQYIALFIIGLLASKNSWFEQLSNKTEKILKRSAWICLLFFPIFFIISTKTHTPTSWFCGGFHWQALLYAIWEQWIGFSILTALLIKGKRKWNTNSELLSKLSRNNFAIYIFHPLIIVIITIVARNWSIDPVIKFLVTAPLIALGSFGFASAILQIPGIKKIL